MIDLKVLSVSVFLCAFVSQSFGLHGGGWRGGDSSDGGNRYSSGGNRRGWGSLKAQLHGSLSKNGWNVVGGPGGGAGAPALIVGIGSADGGGYGGGGSGYGGGGSGYGGGGSSGGWGSGGGKPPRGSQVYLQDPWNHEHNYFDDKHGHSKHGWGSGHQISRLPDHATYVQKLVPVLNLSNGLKRLTSALEGVHPNLKWQKPSLAFFGLDGSAHNVKISGHGGQYENDGWGYNHHSHHTGHTVNSKPHYSTW